MPRRQPVLWVPGTFGTFAFAALLFSGCAVSNPIHQPGLVTTWNRHIPLPPVETPPINMVLHTRYTIYDDRPASSSLVAWLSGRASYGCLKNVLPEFPVLKKAQFEFKEAPYTLVIEATHAMRGNELRSCLSSMTLFIIPNTWKNVLELHARLYHGSTLLKTYEATGAYRLHQHLLFLPLVGWRFAVPARLREDTFRDLFFQIQQDADELFQVPPATHTGP